MFKNIISFFYFITQNVLMGKTEREREGEREREREREIRRRLRYTHVGVHEMDPL